MSCKGKRGAERKFWRTPELVEKLLPLLDARSTSRLAHVHHLTVELLQAASFWNDLIRRTCPYNELMPDNEFSLYRESEYGIWVEQKFHNHQRVINPLTSLLRKMGNPKVSLLELLHVVCERYPPVAYRFDDKPTFFQLGCPCKKSHSVSHLGFMLLEELEEALGTVEQKVEKVCVDYLQEPWLSALSSRASRQQERWKWWKQVERVDANRFKCRNWWDLENFLFLVQNCQRMALEVVEVQNNLGAKGWADLAQAFPLIHGVDTFHVDRRDTLGANKEDLKTIFDALDLATSRECLVSVHGVVGGRGRSVEITWQTEEEKEDEWMTFEEILDGTTFNWQKRYGGFGSSEEEQDEEEEVEGEGEEEEEEEQEEEVEEEEVEDEGEEMESVSGEEEDKEEKEESDDLLENDSATVHYK